MQAMQEKDKRKRSMSYDSQGKIVSIITIQNNTRDKIRQRIIAIISNFLETIVSMEAKPF